MNAASLVNADLAAEQSPEVDAMNSRLSHPYSFVCSEYFHLAELSPVCSLIYGLAYKVTKGGESTFHASAQHVGEYINRSASQVRRGFGELEELGFFELKDSGKFQTNNYRVLSHNGWAESHPDRCCSKETFPYTDQGDPLGIELWKITGGKVHFQRFQINNYRNIGSSEGEIIELFKDFWESTGSKMRPTDASKCFYRFLQSHNGGDQ